MKKILFILFLLLSFSVYADSHDNSFADGLATIAILLEGGEWILAIFSSVFFLQYSSVS